MTENQAEPRQPGSQPDEGLLPPLPSDDIRVLAEAACKKIGLETRWRKSLALEPDGEYRYSLIVAIPNGINKRSIFINDAKASLINSVGIRPAIALGDYEAFLYIDNSEIEAQL